MTYDEKTYLENQLTWLKEQTTMTGMYAQSANQIENRLLELDEEEGQKW